MPDEPLEERDGWYVVNVKDAHWFESPVFGKSVLFEDRDSYRARAVGVRLHILEPGKPNCRYHRESAQENFLVLSGRCRLLVNGEQRRLEPWDFVHCAPGVSHVFVGEGDGPCVMLMVGDRPEHLRIFYPRHAAARAVNAEAPEPTADPRVAYSDVTPWAPTESRDWPLDG
ncbi:MAG TPA: cupin domain-containing protein [Candidatus Polarisedimenticolaceae bacterium]|nr:cupin domain-containing protein [Candidatus Polarisedimenticolaceae bacterium]